MENNKGLELSLGLACGRSSSPSIDKSENSADDRMDTDERTSKILNDFRNFLNAGIPQSFERTDPVKPEENLFNKFQQTTSDGNDSANREGASDHKRKSTFVGTENNKKQETGSYSSVLQEKEKHSHISITTDEGSTGDNEDVADSEVEGTTSRTTSYRDDASSSQAPKDVNGKSNISATSIPAQTMDMPTVPYSITAKESLATSVRSTSIYPSSMQNFPPINGQLLPRPHGTSAGSVPMSFVYSSMQVPDKDSPWGMSRHQALLSPNAGRSIPTSASLQETNLRSSEPAQSDVQPPKQEGEEGSSSQPEGKAGPQPSSSFPSEYPVKFGGSGSIPNLPWVSTTGPGPNGKTISGVTYKFSATQIKIVCACHGLHLSPQEFIRHATDDRPSPVTSTGLASLQSSNPGTTSAKS